MRIKTTRIRRIMRPVLEDSSDDSSDSDKELPAISSNVKGEQDSEDELNMEKMQQEEQEDFSSWGQCVKTEPGMNQD